MKKIFGIICAIFILYSCTDQRPDEYKRTQRYIENNLEYSIHKINYEGHSYLIYDQPRRGGICHDQNCECLKEK